MALHVVDQHLELIHLHQMLYPHVIRDSGFSLVEQLRGLCKSLLVGLVFNQEQLFLVLELTDGLLKVWIIKSE